MKLYNTLSNKIENFSPLNNKEVTFYSCGPTVYQSPTIGNWRTYVFGDVVKRTLKYYRYPVKHVMNFTDVGHLTSDADFGQDKLEKSAQIEKKSAWQIADQYIKEFIEEAVLLNIEPPLKYTRATEYLKDQIDLIKVLEAKNLTYRTKDGLYFDTAKFKDYGQLFKIDKEGLKEGARVEKNPEKKNITDFALWKFSPDDRQRDMEWPSPWGIGFPGWHLECSAMILSELGQTIDIHLGGVDLAPVHHNNEIAQSESATGKPLAKYWLHGELLLIDGQRMGKSQGNAYTLRDIIDQGFSSLDLRYFFFSAHYRTKLNFNWLALQGARKNLHAIKSVIHLKDRDFKPLPKEKITGRSAEILKRFEEAIENDLNLPQAIAALNSLTYSKEINQQFSALYYMDQILGLNLLKKDEVRPIPDEVMRLKAERDQAREEKKWTQADEIRAEIESMGYKIEDSQDSSRIIA